jgi:hypothetical protein
MSRDADESRNLKGTSYPSHGERVEGNGPCEEYS